MLGVNIRIVVNILKIRQGLNKTWVKSNTNQANGHSYQKQVWLNIYNRVRGEYFTKVQSITACLSIYARVIETKAGVNILLFWQDMINGRKMEYEKRGVMENHSTDCASIISPTVFDQINWFHLKCIVKYEWSITQFNSSIMFYNVQFWQQVCQEWLRMLLAASFL